MGGFTSRPSPPAPPPQPPKPKPMVQPTEAEYTQSSAADANLDVKKRGRRATVLTGSLGLSDRAEVSKKTLLGG
jgi:hypothetical protein